MVNLGMVRCPRCGQERPVIDGTDPIERATARAWDMEHTPPGQLIMTYPELRAAVNEYAQSHDLVESYIAAALAGGKYNLRKKAN